MRARSDYLTGFQLGLTRLRGTASFSPKLHRPRGSEAAARGDGGVRRSRRASHEPAPGRGCRLPPGAAIAATAGGPRSPRARVRAHAPRLTPPPRKQAPGRPEQRQPELGIERRGTAHKRLRQWPARRSPRQAWLGRELCSRVAAALCSARLRARHGVAAAPPEALGEPAPRGHRRPGFPVSAACLSPPPHPGAAGWTGSCRF